jgi:hypothetical protein
MPRVFAYIIATVLPDYRLNGCVPWVSQDRVFFGPCKKRMRPQLKPGDYIMGISPSGIGKQRRVLIWMQVSEKMTFAEAYLRGNTDRLFRAARGHAIHVRPKEESNLKRGNTASYEHITDAPHAHKWRKDIKGKRDVFLVGSRKSWVAGVNGPEVTGELIELLQKGVNWGKATVKNPLTQNARGKHAVLSGRDARRVLDWVPRVSKRVQNSEPATRSVCVRSCSCDKE